jgi:hypothetical protein
MFQRIGLQRIRLSLSLLAAAAETDGIMERVVAVVIQNHRTSA